MQNKAQSQKGVKLYPARIVMVVLFSLIQMMTAILFSTVTPIATYLTIVYGYDSVVINLATLMFTVMLPFFTLPAVYILDSYGSRMGIIIGSLLCLVGVGLRLLVNFGFYWVIIGQALAGMGRPFIINCQTKLAQNWFRPISRGTITQILSLVLSLATILGVFIPGLIFNGYQPNQSNIEEGRQITFKVMWVQLIIAVCCYIPNIIFQQDKPPTPPSDSADIPRESFTIAMPKLFTNKNYVLLLCAFGCYAGSFNGISVVLSYLLQPWFGEEDLPLIVAWVVGAQIIFGIIGMVIFGYINRKHQIYKILILICMAGTCVAIAIFYPILQTKMIVWVSLASALVAFFRIPVTPIMLELGCQIGFPVGESSATGLLFGLGSLFGFLVGVLMSLIVQGQTKGQSAAGLGFSLGLFVAGFILMLILKQQKNRSNFQNQLASQKQEAAAKARAEAEKRKEQTVQAQKNKQPEQGNYELQLELPLLKNTISQTYL